MDDETLNTDPVAEDDPVDPVDPPALNPDSILDSVKRDLAGLMSDDNDFDATLINDINSVFVILWQMGVGPRSGFRITDNSTVWTDYIEESPVLNLVRSYVPKKVKMMFDVPNSGAATEALKEQIKEDEWRISVTVDPANTFEEGGS